MATLIRAMPLTPLARMRHAAGEALSTSPRGGESLARTRSGVGRVASGCGGHDASGEILASCPLHPVPLPNTGRENCTRSTGEPERPLFLPGMQYTTRRIRLLRTISSRTEGRLLRGAGKSGTRRPAVFMAELRRTDSLPAVDWKSRAAKALIKSSPCERLVLRAPVGGVAEPSVLPVVDGSGVCGPT